VRFRLSILLPCLLLSACTGLIEQPGVVDPACGDNCPGPVDPDPDPGPDPDPACTETRAYFRDHSWPEVFSRCVTCHVAGGQANGTRFMLKSPSLPGSLETNMQIVAEVASIEQDSRPLIVLKPTQAVSHGGGQQVPPGSDMLATLEETITRLKTTCRANRPPPPDPVTQGVTLLDPFATLRKASYQLVGRPPTAAEIAAIDSGGIDALDGLIDAMMTTDAFSERLREVFSDVLLTDGFRANNSQGGEGGFILDYGFYPAGAITRDREDWDWRSWPNGEGILLTEALAREPVEFVVQAVRADRPLSEILTARYRLLNAYSARFFKLPYKGFAPGTPFTDIPNPREYLPVEHVPGINEDSTGQGEYAGILTTSAFLQRYPTTPTNFNRKRARMVYKYFLDFDIMKTAPRIDASAVDLNAYPTRNNAQCTGCHAQIDPLAGAFMNQDECGYEDEIYYRTASGTKSNECRVNGWVAPDRMFSPGVGPGAALELSLADRPTALEKLAAHVVAQDAFARSIVTHLYSGLMGRPPLVAPTDPSIPGYANLDAAFEAEKRELDRLVVVLKQSALRGKPVIREIIKSPAFRAGTAEVGNRLELVGLGGGTLSTPEVLDRKIQATTGVRWRRHLSTRRGDYDGSTDAYLVLRDGMKTLYGGTDQTFNGVKARQRLPSTLTAAIVERMALEVACEASARDFDKPAAQRLLFPLVEKTLLPSGDINAPQQAPIVENIRYLHRWLLGERLAANDPEIVATYELLVRARTDGLADINGGRATASLGRPCASDMDLATGNLVSGTTQDATYSIRAWQTVIAYMLMDYTFIFEP
jgi:hypothetical protein